MDPLKVPAPQETKLHFLDYWRIIRIRKTVILAVFLLVVITATLVLALASLAAGVLYWNAESPVAGVPVGDIAKPSICAGDTFYKSVSALLDAAKYSEAAAFSDERLKTCPSDHYAWFYKAKALAIEKQWDPALEALARAELLRPDWRYAYTKPLRESIEWNKSQSK